MDFNNRSAHPQPAAHSTPAAGPSVARKNSSNDDGKWARIGVVAAVVAVVILLLGVIGFAVSSDSVKAEDKYVDNSKLQAVFLNTGQVYFGNVKSLNNKYIVLGNIYYLQTSNGSSADTNKTNANSNVSLVKLGCELHEPYDQMVINRDQVTFWENLQDNGQVAKAVTAFEKQNPNGQKCSDQSSAASTNSGNTTQNAGSSNNSNGSNTNQ